MYFVDLMLRAIITVPLHVQWEDVNSELPSSSKKRKFAGFLEICMVHGGKTNVRLAIMNYANLKKAFEFLFFGTNRKFRINFLPLYDFIQTKTTGRFCNMFKF